MVELVERFFFSFPFDVSLDPVAALRHGDVPVQARGRKDGKIGL